MPSQVSPYDHLDPLRQALADMEVEWRRLGAPIVPRLRPGLSDGQIDDLGARYGWAFPDEERVLWEWHDGSDPMGFPQHQAIGPGGLRFLSSEEALQGTLRQREMAPHHPPPAARPGRARVVGL
jgi:hypothetical protein